jgi:hypothetical protein
MTIEKVYSAALDAVRTFGPAYKNPLEIAQVTRDGTSAVYTVAFNDLRNSREAGPILAIDIDTVTHTTIPMIRDYVIGRIASYLE